MTTFDENLTWKNIDFVVKRELLKVIQNLDYKKVRLCIETGSEEGNSLQGDVYRVRWKRPQTHDPDSVILKVAPTFLERREHSNTRIVFMREIFMYDKILPLFANIQLAKGINPKENGFNEYINCYTTTNEEMSESLILEDLKQRHFEMIDIQQEPLTFNHISLLMKTIGKFHALSFALRDQQSNKFQALIGQLNEIFWGNVAPRFDLMCKTSQKEFYSVLEEENRFDLLQKMNELMNGNDFRSTVNRFTSGLRAEPYSVICHGDLTTYNIMFRKNEQGKPIDIQLIDWQFTRYASPVTEIMLCLLCLTTKELRSKHYEEFLKIYHESLSSFLSRLGSDVQKLFPYSTLLAQLKEFGAYAAIVAIPLTPYIFGEHGSMLNIMGTPNAEEILKKRKYYQVKSKEIYNQRIIDMLEDLIRFGYI